MKSILSLLVVILLISCSKYEEGNNLSLKSNKSRITNTWEIEKAYRNDTDVTQDYYQYTLQLLTDGNASLAALYVFGDYTFEGETNGTWRLEDNDLNLNLDFENNQADEKFQIIKLTSKELWLREIGGTGEIHFRPVD